MVYATLTCDDTLDSISNRFQGAKEFLEVDADKDYHIDQAEFFTFLNLNGYNGTIGLQEFAKMDANGDGKISSVEFDSDLSEEMVEKEHRK